MKIQTQRSDKRAPNTRTFTTAKPEFSAYVPLEEVVRNFPVMTSRDELIRWSKRSTFPSVHRAVNRKSTPMVLRESAILFVKEKYGKLFPAKVQDFVKAIKAY